MIKWNVVRWNVNLNKAEYFNVFDNWGFTRDIVKALDECPKEKLEKQILREARYYFSYKFEYECAVNYLFSETNEKATRIDVYEQIETNIHAFCEYLLSHKQEIHIED